MDATKDTEPFIGVEGQSPKEKDKGAGPAPVVPATIPSSPQSRQTIIRDR